jgi:light-regulated signal transduction histidine kinase (bacteriophytochrome)
MDSLRGSVKQPHIARRLLSKRAKSLRPNSLATYCPCRPLRVVSRQLLAKRYQGRLTPTPMSSFITFAGEGCNRMQELIQDLLAYTRAGPNRKALEKVSAEDALETALMNPRIAIENSGAVITHASQPADTTDETQLAQVFQNLVGNAIKCHGAEAPRVHVSATRNGGNEWISSVRATGLGIDPQYSERIFIIFQAVARA